MTDEIDFPKSLAEELAKQLPVKDIYEDGLAPATKGVGTILADLIDTVHLALAPIQYTAMLQKRFRRFIERSAQGIPLERRVLPAPQLLGPILEGIRYQPEGSPSDEAFAQLLNRAFDRERVGQAHPSFPAILRTLADDELTLLRRLESEKISVPCSLQRGEEWKLPSSRALEDIAPYLQYPANILVYLEHIESSGLINSLIGTSTEESRTDAEGFCYIFWEPTLSNFGRMFVKAIE